MRTTQLFFTFLLVFSASMVFSQQLEDCTLGLGGKDRQTIIEIFQLNEEQQLKMEAWAAQLQTQNKLVEDQIKELFDKHPQSTTEDLNTLAGKYDVLKSQLVSASKEYDRKLLALFNQRQYERYEALCKAAYRRPLTPPEIVKDSVQPE